MLHRIAFLGTGLMGAGMAATLARKGFHVSAWNRTPDRAAPLAGDGVTLVTTPVEAARAADIVIAMLPHVGTLAALLDDGVADALRPGCHVIDCSTSAPEASRALARRLAAIGVTMLDAPVFGSKDAAAAGELTFVVGGDHAAYDACAPLLDAMGRRRFYVGGNGYGCAAKLGFNLIIAGTTQAFAEALALTGACGVDPALMVEIVMAGRARSGIIEMKAPGMLAGDFTPFFALKHMRKDIDLMLETAGSLHLPLPATAALSRLYHAAIDRGLGERDFSAILKMLDRPDPSPAQVAPTA